eukprot:10311246-Prorocentrum_lima.AAC.1
MYGLEALQITKDVANMLDVFQLKGYRKILHMQTTYVDRRNTNAKVLARVAYELNKDRLGLPYIARYLSD